ncbi:hypothetical protein [Streptomyces sp. ODS28]|uniref:hypothetical protein n=1 Tax=Streptomyces sp. ODS28 TaxID=3136688 RepID=UPI0031EB3FAC
MSFARKVARAALRSTALSAVAAAMLVAGAAALPSHLLPGHAQPHHSEGDSDGTRAPTGYSSMGYGDAM